jgi:hypothetical protein
LAGVFHRDHLRLSVLDCVNRGRIINDPVVLIDREASYCYVVESVAGEIAKLVETIVIRIVVLTQDPPIIPY